MSTLHFTRYVDPLTHQAEDADHNVYLASPQGKGWIGRIYDADWNLVHQTDWSDFPCHIDEMRKHLQRMADAGSMVAA